MNLFEMKSHLESIGFRSEKNSCRSRIENKARWYAWRKSAVPARECECNKGKPMQIIVFPYSYLLDGDRRESVEVSLRGEFGAWWDLKAYGLSPQECVDKLDDIERSLVSAWNALRASA